MKIKEDKNKKQKNVKDTDIEIYEIKCPVDKISPVRDRCMSTF